MVSSANTPGSSGVAATTSRTIAGQTMERIGLGILRYGWVALVLAFGPFNWTNAKRR